MQVYYSLVALASFVGDVRASIMQMAQSTKDVFVVGQYLFQWFVTIYVRSAYVQSYIQIIAYDYLDFYNAIMAKVNTSGNLQTLLHYADDLISFMRDPGYYIRNALNYAFPSLARLSSDPVSFVLETLYTRTGLSYEFVQSPLNIIRNLINAELGAIAFLKNDPVGYIIQQLSARYWFLNQFLNDPASWVRGHVVNLFPGLAALISNPVDYILEIVVNGLDSFTDRYQARLVNLFVKIIDRIF